MTPFLLVGLLLSAGGEQAENGNLAGSDFVATADAVDYDEEAVHEENLRVVRYDLTTSWASELERLRDNHGRLLVLQFEMACQ